MARYQVVVAGRELDIEVEYRSEKYRVTINGQTREVEVFNLDTTRALLLIDHESHEVDVRARSGDGRRGLFMHGVDTTAEIESYYLAQLRKAAGMSAVSVERVVRAPMPGLVLEVKVSAGQQVTAGQALAIVEAMKMENVIKAPAGGTVKAVHAVVGKSVEKGDKLVEME